MVEISQTVSLDIHKISNIIGKFSRAEYEFSGDAIRDDIAKLEKIASKYKAKNTLINAANTTKYLERLLKKSNKRVRLVWGFDEKKRQVRSVPIEMLSIPMFDINTYDYIVLDKSKKLVNIDYQELLNLMVFEASYRDLMDYDKHVSLQEVDDKLHDAGINVIGVYDTDRLNGIIPDNIYRDAKVCRIEDSRYVSLDKSIMYDYFNNEVEIKTGRKLYYADWIQSSGNTAMALILKSILSTASACKVDIQIAGVSDTTLSFVVNRSFDMNKIIEDVRVMIFGRKFRVKPRVYEY